MATTTPPTWLLFRKLLQQKLFSKQELLRPFAPDATAVFELVKVILDLHDDAAKEWFDVLVRDSAQQWDELEVEDDLDAGLAGNDALDHVVDVDDVGLEAENDGSGVRRQAESSAAAEATAGRDGRAAPKPAR